MQPPVRLPRLGGVQCPAAAEDGQLAEQGLLGAAEEIVAPGDRVAQRPLAGRQVAPAADQQRQPPLQAGQHRLGRQQPDAGGGKLNRQRQPIQPERLSDGGRDEARLADRGEGDEAHSVREVGRRAGGQVYGEASLAGAAGASEGEQPRLVQEAPGRRELPLPSDEARQRQGGLDLAAALLTASAAGST
jgi:hypothetical protein